MRCRRSVEKGINRFSLEQSNDDYVARRKLNVLSITRGVKLGIGLRMLIIYNMEHAVCPLVLSR